MRISFHATTLSLLALLVACQPPPDDSGATESAQTAANHTFDLASHMPAHLAIMDTMSWFGVPTSANGPDSSWGNWDIGTMKCVPSRSPAQCDASGDRDVASKFHPLVGAYSSSGNDAQGVGHIQLMLSNLRSDCDDSARIDAYAIQLNGTHYTSLHGGSSAAPNLSLESLDAFLREADKESRVNAVLPSDDASWYWNNGHYEKLDCSTAHATCLAYLQQDIVDMVQIASSHPSAVRINGKLLLHFYIDTTDATPAEWSTILANARAVTGKDFYTVAQHANATYFAAFDALAPWVDPSYWWQHTSGATVRAHAAAYAKALTQPLLSAAPAGRVVFGDIAPGFDDFTEEWGKCVVRELPAGDPRDLDLMRGIVDYLSSAKIQGVVMTTWDDWTEGTFFEPSVEEGTSKLVTLRQSLGALFGDAQSASGDAALDARWRHYGKPNTCAGTSAFTAPAQCTSAPACEGPTILEPTASESVGPAIHLRVSGGACLDAMIAYIDGVQAAKSSSNAIDQWVPVSMGTHTLHVNAWEPDGTLHKGAVDVTFDRTY